MPEPNPDLLRAYLMRGAVTGTPTESQTVTRYCAGKMDNGFPCRIVMLGDELYCKRHKTEIEALEAGAPLPIGRAERPKETKAMAKRGNCKACHRKDMVISGAGMCGTCYNKAKAAGTYPEPADILPEKTVISGSPTGIGYDDENEKAELAGGPITIGDVGLVAKDSFTTGLGQVEPLRAHNLTKAGAAKVGAAVSEYMAAIAPTDGSAVVDACAKILQIPSVVPAFPQGQIETSPQPRKGLAALVCPAPAPLPLPTGLHIPFSLEELSILAKREVTAEHIRRFVVLGLEQKLRPVDNEDPLAKIRIQHV